jgi:hypothetical protein
MNEVLQDGSNKSPLLSGEEGIQPLLGGANTFNFDDNEENLDVVKSLPLTDSILLKNEFGSAVKRANIGSFQDSQRKPISSSGSFGFQVKKETLTQR